MQRAESDDRAWPTRFASDHRLTWRGTRDLPTQFDLRRWPFSIDQEIQIGTENQKPLLLIQTVAERFEFFQVATNFDNDISPFLVDSVRQPFC